MPGLGYLEGSEEEDIHKHTRLELPYWMAQMLAVYDIISIQQPKPYGARVRSALNASASSVRLRDLVPYWYAMALRLSQLLDSEEMKHWLAKVGGCALTVDLYGETSSHLRAQRVARPHYNPQRRSHRGSHARGRGAYHGDARVFARTG